MVRQRNCRKRAGLQTEAVAQFASTAMQLRRNADVCLIPEMNINLEKLMDYVTEVQTKIGQKGIVGGRSGYSVKGAAM